MTFRLPINEQGWGLFTRLIVNFRRSEKGDKALRVFLMLIVLLVLINVLNIVSSYVGRDFMSALADRNTDIFIRQGLIYILVFAGITFVSVILRFCEERLGLLWREFMTSRFVSLYVTPPTYYRMNDELIRQSGVEHPDQRIADDVKNFTTVTLSFIVLLLNGLFTVIAFSGVLWMISPWLFGAALTYAAVGSYITIRVGSQLIELNYRQLDKEAVFRSSLIHVRERAESIALLHHEDRLQPRIMRQFNDLAANFREIIKVNRNLGFFTSGYYHLIQIIPILLVAPLFIQGRVEFGVVTQSAMAFGMLVGAFSLIITQFQSLSSYAAVIQRLINLWYVIELAQTETVSGLDVQEEDNQVDYQGLTLFSPSDKRVLVNELTLTIPRGLNVRVTGTEAAREALFKATAGIYDAGKGLVRRPPLDRILFMPIRPYLPPGSLRQCLIQDYQETPVSDEQMKGILDQLDAGYLVERSGGLDMEHDWDTFFSPQEQRVISFARIFLARPDFVVMAGAARDLDLSTRTKIFDLLDQRAISLIIMDNQEKHDADTPQGALLEIAENGEWHWSKNP